MCRSVCVLVQKVYCGKMADWIWIPFRVVSGVSRGMGVLDGVHVPQRERGGFGGRFVPIGLNGIFNRNIFDSCMENVD